MTDSEPNQGQNKEPEARLRDPGLTGPDAMVLRGAVPRPRPSGTDVNTGTGRAPEIDRVLEAIADLHLATGAGWKDDGRAGFIEHVRAILAKTGPTPIDRGALLELLSDETGWEWDGEQDEPAPIFGCDTRVPSSRQALEAFADRILALVRPVEGVTLTPGMSGCALAWLDIARQAGYVPDDADRMVVARLEARS